MARSNMLMALSGSPLSRSILPCSVNCKEARARGLCSSGAERIVAQPETARTSPPTESNSNNLRVFEEIFNPLDNPFESIHAPMK